MDEEGASNVSSARGCRGGHRCAMPLRWRGARRRGRRRILAAGTIRQLRRDRADARLLAADAVLFHLGWRGRKPSIEYRPLARSRRGRKFFRRVHCSELCAGFDDLRRPPELFPHVPAGCQQRVCKRRTGTAQPVQIAKRGRSRRPLPDRAALLEPGRRQQLDDLCHRRYPGRLLQRQQSRQSRARSRRNRCRRSLHLPQYDERVRILGHRRRHVQFRESVHELHQRNRCAPRLGRGEARRNS